MKRNSTKPVSSFIGAILAASLFIACGTNNTSETSDTAGKPKTPDTTIVTDNDPVGNYYGVDISKWNGDEVAEITPADSLSFIICKATEGMTGVDPEFKQNWGTIRSKNMILGAYHFYHTDDDPLTQASHFWATISAQGKTDIPPIVDIEELSLPSGGTVDNAKLQSDLLKFMNALEASCQRVPMLYTDESFANLHLTNPAFAKYPLWLAEYTRGNPKVPVTWQAKGYTIWQKSGSHDINSQPTDYDFYHGKKSGLTK